jgi:hypothetical protein
MKRLKYLKLFENFSQGSFTISPELKKRLNNIMKLSRDMEANTIALDIIDMEGKQTPDGVLSVDISDDMESFVIKTKTNSEEEISIPEFVKTVLKNFYKLNYSHSDIEDFLDAYYNFRPHSRMAA